jgi:hypothetical protein
MNTYISTHEYMLRASLDYNKKLSECTDQELEQIRKKVIAARADKAGLVTDTMRQKYGRNWNY